MRDPVFPRFSPARTRALAALLVSAVTFAGPGLAQQPPAPPPATSPPAATPAPPPEAPKPADNTEASGGELRDVAPLPVVRFKGQSTWDEGFNALKKAIADLEAEAKRLNLPRAGNPMAYFVDSDDLGFTYEAMLPLASAPAAGTAFGAGFDHVMSPSGRAAIFSNEGAYDDIDTAYEALTAWLDDKKLVATGKFLEEYEFIPEKSEDTTMKLKIVVFLK